MSSNRKYPASATASTNRKFSVSQESVRTSSGTAATGAFVEMDSGLDATVISTDRDETRSADFGATRAAVCGRSGFSGTFTRGSGLPCDPGPPPGVGPGAACPGGAATVLLIEKLFSNSTRPSAKRTFPRTKGRENSEELCVLPPLLGERAGERASVSSNPLLE